MEQKRLRPPLHHFLARPSHSSARQMKRAVTAATGRPGSPGRPSWACLTSPWPYSVSPPPDSPSAQPHLQHPSLKSGEDGGRGAGAPPPAGGQEETTADKTGCYGSRLGLLCPLTLECGSQRGCRCCSFLCHRLGAFGPELKRKSTVLFSIFDQNVFSRHQ